MRDRHALWRRIILAGVLLCLILAGFFVYLHTTRNMTVKRNANYVADAASQTAKRIDDLLVGAENSISAIARMYERSLDPSRADVETLEKLLAVNAPLCSANRDMLEQLVPFTGCGVLVNTAAVETTGDGLKVKNLRSGEEMVLPADTVILAVGFRSDTQLFDQMQDADEIYAIGDCKQFKNVHQAVWDAFEIANNL